MNAGRQLANIISARFGVEMGTEVDPETFASATDCLRIVKRTAMGYLPVLEGSRFEEFGPWDRGPVADFVRRHQTDMDWYLKDENARDTPHRDSIDRFTGGLASRAVAELRQRTIGEVLSP